MKHTEESRTKISESTKGRVPWNKGLNKSDPRVLKNTAGISIKNKGRIPWNKGIVGVQKWSEKRREIAKEMRGEKSPCWTGTNLAYFKRKVKERDNNVCQICGMHDVEIMQVDHIVPVSVSPELKLDMNNMRTLCPNCHARKSLKEKRTKTVNGLA